MTEQQEVREVLREINERLRRLEERQDGVRESDSPAYLRGYRDGIELLRG
jgi:hypothetical protein